MIAVNALLFILGLVLLVKGSDFFVKSSANIAKKFGVSEFIIGLTLISLGTSLPELTSSIIASIKHESGLVIGTIVGANIANIGLIIGIAAIISTLKTNKMMLGRDGYVMLFGSILLFIFIFDGVISRIEGIVLILLYAAYMMFLFETRLEYKGEYGFSDFTKYFFRFEYIMTIRRKLISGIKRKKSNKIITEEKKVGGLFKVGILKDFFILLVSGFLVICGANFFVNEERYG